MSKLQYSHGDIAMFTRCPKLPKWCQKIPKRFQNETLGLPKCSKVEPSGILRVAKVPPKSAKKSPCETLGSPRPPKWSPRVPKWSPRVPK